MGSAASTVQSTKKKPRRKRVEFSEGRSANDQLNERGERQPGEPPSPQSPPNSRDTSSSGGTRSSDDSQSAVEAVANNPPPPTEYSDGVTFTLVEEIPADLNLSTLRPSAVAPQRESEYRFHVPRGGAGQPTQAHFIQSMDRGAIANWIDRTNSFQVTTFVNGIGVAGSAATTAKDGKAPVPTGKGPGRMLSPPSTVSNQPPPAATAYPY
jgi:hypothetical protein